MARRETAPAARRGALGMAAALTGMGVLHFARPRPFDSLIPRSLPGPRRAWTYGSGAAELAVAGLLAVPATRRTGGRAAQALFLAVWPGNVFMAWRWRRRPWPQQLLAWARIPLQIPMIRAAGSIARHAQNHPGS